MTKQTAVEWLVEQVNADCLNSTFIRKELIDEALEREKKELTAMCDIGSRNDAIDSEKVYQNRYGK
jgi:hypothetical protein